MTGMKFMRFSGAAVMLLLFYMCLQTPRGWAAPSVGHGQWPSGAPTGMQSCLLGTGGDPNLQSAALLNEDAAARGPLPSIYIAWTVTVPISGAHQPVPASPAAASLLNVTARHRTLAARGAIRQSRRLDIAPIIYREAVKNGLDPWLLRAVIEVESTFNPRCLSHSGAMGLCQLMPGTAASLGVKNPWEPAQNIAAGAKYLGRLVRKFKDQDLAVAAYNAGPGAVARAGGIPHIAETVRYVGKVRRAMAHPANPAGVKR